MSAVERATRPVPLMTSENDPAGENRYFDQRYCGKVMRIGAAACAAVVLCSILFLAIVDPSHTSCPAWMLPKERVTAWMLIPIVSLWAAWLGFWAIRWDLAAKLTVGRFEHDERLAARQPQAGWMYAVTNFRIHRARARLQHALAIDFGWLLIAIMIGSVFFCAVPLLLVVGNCF